MKNVFKALFKEIKRHVVINVVGKWPVGRPRKSDKR
tara:strand:+ start:903 stop:1010 length:108 start_codon:yes stop_codon:yes gene_type:complete